MSKCLKGNRTAQKQLYEHYKVQLFVVCLRYANSKFEAEDFLQEGFVKLFRNLDRYDPTIAPLGAWMKRIFINVCLDQIRKKRKRPYVDEIANHQDQVITGSSALDHLNEEDLLNIIHELPDGYRSVFNLYVIDGYKHKEIAEKLDISENTSKSQLYKARKQIQEILEQRENQLVDYGE